MTQESPLSRWNRSPASTVRSDNPLDAANRIHDGFADIGAQSPGRLLQRDSKIFTMGSCFAREIESALTARGGTVVSMDRQAIAIPEFSDGSPKGFRTGFFHRFTPAAMAQEFERCFDELVGWSDDALLLERSPGSVTDLHYWSIPGMPNDRDAALVRRNVARSLVRTAADADLIVLTLGLIESWVHLPTGLHANKIDPKVVARNKADFAFTRQTYADTLDCLARIRRVLEKHHATGDFEIVVTVSPVPLQTTFTMKDIVVANMDSKATLRAAATAFTEATEGAYYFPSFEMVTYTDPALAWQADRTHVRPDMVRHIVQTFTDAYYVPGTFN